MPNTYQFTELHKWHISQGAKMGHFGGYEMPLWYPIGTKIEHQSVISRAGLFDTGHMATILVSGPDAFQLLQYCFSRDLNACIGKNKHPLSPGRCLYGIFLNQKGEVIDDAIVFFIGTHQYMIVVNAGMGNTIAHHLTDHKNNYQATIANFTEKFGKIDIQGPLAAKILSAVIKEPHQVFETFPFFSFKGYPDVSEKIVQPVYLKSGEPLMVSRTGYTGEFGFELFIKRKFVLPLWEMLIEQGKPLGLTPCGLAARDSLRTGALLPLSQKDIGAWPFVNNPWQFALPYDETGKRFSKPFIGSDHLNPSDNSHTYAFAGFDPRKIDAESANVFLEGKHESIGRILSCTTDMAISRVKNKIYSMAGPDKPESFHPRGLCCGFIKVNMSIKPGTIVTLKDNRRAIQAEIVSRIRPHRSALTPIKTMI